MTVRRGQKFTFISYVTIMFMLSLMPAAMIKSSIWKYDKIIHFVEYFILGFLMLNCFHISAYHIKQIFYCIIFSIIISTTDEFIVQNFFGVGRIPDIYDWTVDVLAATIGLFLRKIMGPIIP